MTKSLACVKKDGLCPFLVTLWHLFQLLPYTNQMCVSGIQETGLHTYIPCVIRWFNVGLYVFYKGEDGGSVGGGLYLFSLSSYT